MEVFVRNAPPQATVRDLREYFRKPLSEFNITVFDVHKFGSKSLASITFLETASGQMFLSKYAAVPLKLNGYVMRCSLSRNTPSEFTLRSLALETTRQEAKKAKQTDQGIVVRTDPADKTNNNFMISSSSCGAWTYTNGHLAFLRHYIDNRPGELIFGRRQAVFLLQADEQSADRIDINYYDVDSAITGDYEEPAITFTLYAAPRFYVDNTPPSNPLDGLTARMHGMSLGLSPPSNTKSTKKERVPCINENHKAIAGLCFVYRARLAHPRDLPKVYDLIRKHPNIACGLSYPTFTVIPAEASLQSSLIRLNYQLTDQSTFGPLPFNVRFQAFRLAQNGKLYPDMVRSMLPVIAKLVRKFGGPATAESIRRLYHYIVPVGPHTEPSDLTLRALADVLESYTMSYDSTSAENAYAIANRYNHIVLVHRIIVTPAGTYLEGPFAETGNRVLRDYSEHSDHFVRVTFQDEDGSAVRYDSRSNQDTIYHSRFKAFLDGTFNIAGLGFSFLGFSHSSLRSQTCWFMAPFVHEKKLMYAPLVIERLGDFSAIRSPARCAARIGQVFTDTSGTVEVDVGMQFMMPDVQRNDRVFSDGCGTISESLLKRIWRVYGVRKALKPTVLQIRYAGAKGVVSLDSRQKEDALTIRPSMIKFEGSRSRSIEICGAAFRPLKMVLNRPMIKLLEDLGVSTDSFLKLQNAAIEQLRMMTESTINASLFLNECSTSKAAQLPYFFELLSDIGLDYHDDTFLRDVVEMGVISKLRDIKYRGRIPVPKGVTLYGIMDETGYLKEGEIYVVTEKAPEGGKEVLTGGRVIVTRSPALHPGDIRIVRAVDVPEDSPLGRLTNCIVFSQHGARDLPSCLSGGDLDGDLYNVIFDPTLMPNRPIAPPADYPRVKPIELSRPVSTKDMSDFFVTFMKTDVLGQISTTHLQLADQKPMGTFDPDCLQLAHMASTAVDFSKTGIAVDMSQCPRYPRCRPDFMAPSPRAVIEGTGVTVIEDDDEEDDDMDEDPVRMLDADTTPMRYYASDKALGHLYRAIDEHRFIASMRQDHRRLTDGKQDTLIPKLWDYVQRNNLFVQWEHNRPLARRIKDAYETTIQALIHEYAPSPRHPLTESELFSGTILGREGGAASKRLRDLTTTMRDRFGEVLEFTVGRVVYGDDGEGDEGGREEGLPRAIACLAVAVEESSVWDRKLRAELRSFRYVAAAAVLREMKRFAVGSTGYYSLPLA